jgi:hypothetical protein
MENQNVPTVIEVNGEEENTLSELIEIAKKLGWEIALEEKEDGDEEMRGLIIGTHEYINDVTSGLEENEINFAIAFQAINLLRLTQEEKSDEKREEINQEINQLLESTNEFFIDDWDEEVSAEN